MAKSKSDEWENHTEIKSETSSRVYVVSQHKKKRHWGCSCPGYRTNRKCKHLTQLGLPHGEEPFEVKKDHAQKKGFLDGYSTYDDSQGRGSVADWRKGFTEKMGLDEAVASLGLPANASWDQVRAALHLTTTESLTRLISEYDAAVAAFDPVKGEAGVAAVKAAQFKVEAYSAYLGEQQAKLDAESARVRGLLLARIRTLAGE